MVFIMNHYKDVIRIPIKQPVTWNVIFFFLAHLAFQLSRFHCGANLMSGKLTALKWSCSQDSTHQLLILIYIYTVYIYTLISSIYICLVVDRYM